MTEQNTVGIVTVTYNSAMVIVDFMESLLKQTYKDFWLYVVDNASRDQTIQALSKFDDPRIVVIKNCNNVGVAEGNNIGIRRALNVGCAWIWLLNNDTVFEPALLEKLVLGLQKQPGDMIVPKIMYYDDPQRIWCAGGYLSGLLASGCHFGEGEKDRGQFDQERLVTYSPTCCMLIKKEVFARIGLMDHNYFVYFDDTDFCFRAFRQGVKLFYLPSATLFHKVGSLTAAENNFSIRYGSRNHVYYVLKNFPSWQSAFFLAAFQLHELSKLLLRSLSFEGFLVAQKGFREGISLYFDRAKSA